MVEQVEQDLEILNNLAATATSRWQLADDYDVVGLAQEFAQTLRGELDYIREGRSAERFAVSFAEDPSIHIPRIFGDTSSSRVLTLERIHGIKIDDLVGLDALGIDRPRLADRAARITLKMVFEDGFFHADPHAGNFFVEADGRIGLIDFGMVGTVDERTQEHLISLLLAVASQDPDELVDALLDSVLLVNVSTVPFCDATSNICYLDTTVGPFVSSSWRPFSATRSRSFAAITYAYRRTWRCS